MDDHWFGLGDRGRYVAMKIPDELKSELRFAFTSLLKTWRVWCGEDEIKALYVGYDYGNAQIEVSLLTDNEPYLAEQELNGFSMSIDGMENVWPTADWRLDAINCVEAWAGAEKLLTWIRQQAETVDDEQFAALDTELRTLLITTVTAESFLGLLSRFRRINLPFRIRVGHFNDDTPFDYSLVELIAT
ncbi:MAG: hypothetical protein GY743_02170 [Planctomycetaceae bacterium]|nr:hypothetical protein [Planctomycetaceae bacterium]